MLPIFFLLLKASVYRVSLPELPDAILSLCGAGRNIGVVAKPHGNH